jgi:hypothetical protein
MTKAEVEIAELSNLILGDPEQYLDRFKEFFAFGQPVEGQSHSVSASDHRIRGLALLSATAVLIDIFPSLVVPLDVQDGEEEKSQRASKEHHAKLRRFKTAVELYDQLVQKLNKNKLVRGITTLLGSPICGRQCLDQKRIQQLVSSAVSLAAQPSLGREAVTAIRNRIRADLENNVDNLEVVKLIVLSITKEKQIERLNQLIPLFQDTRFVSRDLSSHKIQSGGAKIDRQLQRDLATGRADYVDAKKIKSAEAQILSEIMALYIRTLRSAQKGGQYSFITLKTCIEGLAANCISVNADLAAELEAELMGIAKFFLCKQSSTEEEGVLGAIALSGVLNITKGGKERAEILSGSVISGTEALIAKALERLLPENVLTALCKGAIGLSARFGSDKVLLVVARALLGCLCTSYNEQSKLAADLLVNVASRSALVRTAIDPEGVLIDGTGLEKEEVSLYPQLAFLMGHFGPNHELSNKLLGHLSKYSKDLASRERTEAVDNAVEREEEEKVVQKRTRLNHRR